MIERRKNDADDRVARCEKVATAPEANTSRSDPAFLAQELTTHGLRMTMQRRTLLEIIVQSPNHLDAATLLRRAQERDGRIHRATVYRTLELLKRLQLIDELDLMHLEGEKHYYEARNKSEHFHLACLCCGRIIEHRTPTFDRLKDEISAQTGFSIDVIRLEVGGQCPGCRCAKAGSIGTNHAAVAAGKKRVRHL